MFFSGVSPQQGLVCQLFCLLYLQYQAYSQVSDAYETHPKLWFLAYIASDFTLYLRVWFMNCFSQCPAVFSNFHLCAFPPSFSYLFLYLFYPCFPPLSSPSFLLVLSEISLWRWTSSRCVNTATNACQTTWKDDLPSASVTQKTRRRNYWYQCVCDLLSLLNLHSCCSFWLV